MQLIDNILAHALGCSRGQRHDRHIREMFSQFFQLAILRPKIVAPLADAMRLVHHEQRRLVLHQPMPRLLVGELLGREEEEFDLPAFEAFEGLAAFGDALGGIEDGRGRDFPS